MGNDYALFGGGFGAASSTMASPLALPALAAPPSLMFIRDTAIKQLDSLVFVANTAVTQAEQLRRENALLRAALQRHRIDPDAVIASGLGAPTSLDDLAPAPGASILRSAAPSVSALPTVAPSLLSSGGVQVGQYSPPSLFSLSSSNGLF
jgi:hypothetical protein